ncbi:MAG: hypothetical protein ACD_63C00054G0010 [uncultured bacterium]|nr:MAG: hypothetical protein ACD_63C00054G0010 [uncultured bacterium]
MIHDYLKRLIINSLPKGVEKDLDFVLEHPREKGFGDYSCNVAIVLTKILKKNPMEIGKDIVEKLQNFDEKKCFSKIGVVKPGFINFELSSEFLCKNLEKILQEGEKWGQNKRGVNKKILVEHTSANPNKSLHVGHLRNICLGDSIARLMRFSGYAVEIQNLINDMGVQVADAMLGIMNTAKKEEDYDRYDRFVGDAYAEVQKTYLENEDFKKERDNLLIDLEKGDEKISDFHKKFIKKILLDQLKTTGRLNVFYDVGLTESSIITSSLFESSMDKLKKTGKFFKEKEGKNKGAWVIKDIGLPNEEKAKDADKILIKSNGVATYSGKDIAYHMWKFGLSDKDFKYKLFIKQKNGEEFWISDKEGEAKSGFAGANMIVNVIDVRQTYTQDVVKYSLKKLGYVKEYENFFHLPYEVVVLSAKTAEELGIDVSDGKKFYPMSGRKGIEIGIDEFLDKLVNKIKKKQKESNLDLSDESAEQVAVGAVKHYMLRYSFNKMIVFDMDEALNFEGNTGPYLQYTHARICGILRKYKSSKPDLRHAFKKEVFSEKEEGDVLRALHIFPEIVESAAKNLEPHLMAEYLYKLAQSFNTFYNAVPVLKAETLEKKLARLLLISAVAIVLKNGLGLLGIEAPSQM